MDIDASVERPLVLCGDHGAGFLDVSSSKTFLGVVITGMESNKQGTAKTGPRLRLKNAES